MNHGPHSGPHTPVPPVDSGDAAMPSRQEALIGNLRDQSLMWQSSRAQEHRSWESGGGSDPRCPDLDPLSDASFLRANSGMRSGSMRRNIGMDWHSVESETLNTETEQYVVSFKKTVARSYSHQLQEIIDRSWYVVDFVSRDDQGQRFSLNETGCPQLRDIFEEIASRAN